MATNNLLPVAVAYFTVRVPANSTVEYLENAQRVVEAYLYSDAGVADVDLDNEDFNPPVYAVTVRVENWKSVVDLTRTVQYQRDRLSSGLYSSTDPKIFTDPNYHVATA